MNERIKRLATLAGGEFYEGFLGSPNSIKFTEDELQKFAELIVRECVRHFNEDYQRDFDTLWREDLSKSIKDHFGVEE